MVEPGSVQTVSVLVAVSAVALTLYFLMQRTGGEKSSQAPKTLLDPMVKYSLPLTEKEVCQHHPKLCLWGHGKKNTFSPWTIKTWMTNGDLFVCLLHRISAMIPSAFALAFPLPHTSLASQWVWCNHSSFYQGSSKLLCFIILSRGHS